MSRFAQGRADVASASDSSLHVLTQFLSEQQLDQRCFLEEWSQRQEKQMMEGFATVCATVSQYLQRPSDRLRRGSGKANTGVMSDSSRPSNSATVRYGQIPKPQAVNRPGFDSPLPPPISLCNSNSFTSGVDHSVEYNTSAQTILEEQGLYSSSAAKHFMCCTESEALRPSGSSPSEEPATPASPPPRITMRPKRTTPALASASGSLQDVTVLAPRRTRQSHGALGTLFRTGTHNTIKKQISNIMDLLPPPVETEDGSKLSIVAMLVKSRYFEGLCAVVILANSANFGLAANYAIDNGEELELYQHFELSFTVFYTIELLLRLIVYHVHFFCNDECLWNIFDLILVISSMYEQLVKYINASSIVGNITIVRMLRVIKMFKLLRMFRLLRIFKELRLLLNAILGSMKSMIWSVSLVIGITYVFGIVFLQAGTACMIEDECSDQPFKDDFINDWGSVEQSMLSLFMAVTGGVDWITPAKPLGTIGITYYIAFLFYIAFFNFIILNTLTSLFLEATLSNAERDHHTVILNEMKKKEAYILKLKQLFSKIESSGDINQEITIDELKDRMREPEMYAFASSIEIDATDIEQFFRILSADGTQPVDIESFVVGCMKLRGGAKSMDLMGLIYSQKKFVKYCDRQFLKLSHVLTALQKRLGVILAEDEGNHNGLRKTQPKDKEKDFFTTTSKDREKQQHREEFRVVKSNEERTSEALPVGGKRKTTYTRHTLEVVKEERSS